MTAMKHKILIGVATFLMFAITTLGYAKLSDSLSISGSVSADAPEPINDIYISDVTVADGTNATIKSVRNNDGNSVEAIIPSEWEVGEPHN